MTSSNGSRIAIVADTSQVGSRGILRGILAYSREKPSWSVALLNASEIQSWLEHRSGDGILLTAEISREDCRFIAESQVPAVRVMTEPFDGIPSVNVDEAAIGSLSARHLLERNYPHFAYFCGWERRFATCGEAFAIAVEKGGFPCAFQEDTGSLDSCLQGSDIDESGLAAWLKALPKPVGIFVGDDVGAVRLLKVCLETKLTVPDAVGLLSVGNDELLCDLSAPSLSSIALDTYGAGYRAGKMLDRWMRGSRPKSLKLPPRGVVGRESTNLIVTQDTDVLRAVQLIRSSACQGISVDEIVEQIPLSRRVLERRFQAILGRSPHEEILNVRFQHVVDLLVNTELSLGEIAARTGFVHTEYLCSAFKRRFGTSALRHRERHSPLLRAT